MAKNLDPLDPLTTRKKLDRLRFLLSSGEAREIVKRSGLTSAEVGEIIGVSQPQAWSALNDGTFPRAHSVALQLLSLLELLQGPASDG